MRLHLCHCLGLLAVHSFAVAEASVFGETFHEELVVDPKCDGRVALNFAFATMVNGAYPRDPNTLGKEDRRT